MEIAREYASRNGVNETTAEKLAELWFDAGKDDAQSTHHALALHLGDKFNID
jgi:hypothetical protein